MNHGLNSRVNYKGFIKYNESKLFWLTTSNIITQYVKSNKENKSFLLAIRSYFIKFTLTINLWEQNYI